MCGAHCFGHACSTPTLKIAQALSQKRRALNQNGRRQTRGNACCTRTVHANINRQACAEPLARSVQKLARQGQQIFQPWQAARQARDMRTQLLEPARLGAQLPPLQIGETGLQVAAHRNRHLGGGRGRWRAPVGGIVNQRGVGFMPDRRD